MAVARSWRPDSFADAIKARFGTFLAALNTFLQLWSGGPSGRAGMEFKTHPEKNGFHAVLSLEGWQEQYHGIGTNKREALFADPAVAACWNTFYFKRGIRKEKLAGCCE